MEWYFPLENSTLAALCLHEFCTNKRDSCECAQACCQLETMTTTILSNEKRWFLLNCSLFSVSLVVHCTLMDNDATTFPPARSSRSSSLSIAFSDRKQFETETPCRGTNSKGQRSRTEVLKSNYVKSVKLLTVLSTCISLF